jgi:Cu/Zn superoxide dismutase
VTGLAGLLLASLALPVAAQTARANLKDANGKDVGSATLTQTPGGVLIAMSLKGLPAGRACGCGRTKPAATPRNEEVHPAERGVRDLVDAAAGEADEDQAEERQREIDDVEHSGMNRKAAWREARVPLNGAESLVTAVFRWPV